MEIYFAYGGNYENIRNVGPYKKAYSYVFSCSKGYYSHVSWADSAEDEG